MYIKTYGNSLEQKTGNNHFLSIRKSIKKLWYIYNTTQLLKE